MIWLISGSRGAPADLATHNCIRIRFPSGAIYKWEFEKRGEEHAIDVSGSLTLDNHHLMTEAAFQGVGFAWISEFAVAPVAAGRLIRVLKDWTPPYPGLCLYYPEHRHVPAGLRAFIGVVREIAPTLSNPVPGIALDEVTAHLGQQCLFGVASGAVRIVDVSVPGSWPRHRAESASKLVDSFPGIRRSLR